MKKFSLEEVNKARAEYNLPPLSQREYDSPRLVLHVGYRLTAEEMAAQVITCICNMTPCLCGARELT